jgi:hypothetical protein
MPVFITNTAAVTKTIMLETISLKEIRVLKLEFCILSLELDDDFFYS